MKREGAEKAMSPVVHHSLGEMVRAGWVLAVLLGLGLVALITAVLVAWPAVAYLAARFF